MTCVAALGMTSGTPAFWALATSSHGGPSSTRVGIITSAGALGGFSGPYVMGYLQQATIAFTAGLVLIALSAVLAGALVVFATRDRQAV